MYAFAAYGVQCLAVGCRGSGAGQQGVRPVKRDAACSIPHRGSHGHPFGESMGSPISDITAEIFLQHLEQPHIKFLLD